MEANDSSIEISKQLFSSMVTITDRNSKDIFVFPPINHEGLHDSSPNQSSSDSPFSSPRRSSFSSSSSISSDSDDSQAYVDSFLHPKECPPAADCISQHPQQLLRNDSRVQVAAFGWLGFGLEILRRRISISNYCYIPGCGALVAAFRYFPLMSTLAAVYIGSLLLKWVRQPRDRQYKIKAMMGVIREKDEKIVKLLDQIAQLNQVLLSHKRSR